MGRLIDTEVLLKKLEWLEEYDCMVFASVKRTIDEIPTVDAIPVVRCKDCIYYNAGFECLKEGYGIEYPQDWYCADGVRRKE